MSVQMFEDEDATRLTLNFVPEETLSPIRLNVIERFFLEGEEQEANAYQNVILDDDPVASHDLGFDSFDTIPRKRLALGVLVAVSVTFVIGVTVWTRSGGVPEQHASGRSTTQEATAVLPVGLEKFRLAAPPSSDPKKTMASPASERTAIEAPLGAPSL